MPKLLTLREVSEILSCSLANCYALVETKKLPSVPVGVNGGGIRIDEDDLKAFIEKRRRGVRAEAVKPVKLKHLA